MSPIKVLLAMLSPLVFLISKPSLASEPEQPERDAYMHLRKEVAAALDNDIQLREILRTRLGIAITGQFKATLHEETNTIDLTTLAGHIVHVSLESIHAPPPNAL